MDNAGTPAISGRTEGRIITSGAQYRQLALGYTAGDIYTVAGNGTAGYAGDGGPATAAELNYTFSVAVDASGNFYIADTDNNAIREVAATTHTQYGIPMLAGYIYTVAGNGTNGYSGDGGPATSAEISQATGVAVDTSGNLYIADLDNSVIRRVDAAGIITTVAGNGTAGYAGDGGPATSAELAFPFGVATDASGNIYIADTANDVIRKVNTAGIITTVAGNGTAGYSGDGGPATSAELNTPISAALDTAGNLYIADSANNTIRKVDTAGIITTAAGNGAAGYSGDGGPAINAELDTPFGAALSPSGNLYIADSYNNVVRRVDTTGIITTVAGTGTAGYSGDGGPATSAELNGTYGVALDAFGNLYIADANNSVIRLVAAAYALLTISPPSFDFGAVAVGQAAPPASFTVTNTGTTSLTISSVTVTGADPADFHITADLCTGVLAPGASCTISVDFAPTGVGIRSAFLTITSDSVAAPVLDVPLTGTGVLPPGTTVVSRVQSVSCAEVDRTPVTNQPAGVAEVRLLVLVTLSVTLIASTGIALLTFDAPLLFPKSVVLYAPVGTQIGCSAAGATVISVLVDTQVCSAVSLCLTITSSAPAFVSLPVTGYLDPKPCRALAVCSIGAAPSGVAPPAPLIPAASEACIRATEVFGQCAQVEALSFCSPVP